MSNKIKGLFINTSKAVCSIYESGKMSYDCLILSDKYDLDYIEVNENNRKIDATYDFYVFNYHWVKMGWLDTKQIKDLPGFKSTIVLEVSPNDPFACVPQYDFDAYLVLDPTCKHPYNSVYNFPRPLEIPKQTLPPYTYKNIPVIGTFGLGATDKGFDEVVKAVNLEFDEAIVRINIPRSENFPQADFIEFSKFLKSISTKPNIHIEVTQHFFDKNELINWCAENTLNVFLYNRRIGNGLSATTDQAIVSGRPLAVSTNPTFRHIHTYIKPYPYQSLKESIVSSIPHVQKIQEDWKPANFALAFEKVLQERQIRHTSVDYEVFTLPLVKRTGSLINKIFSRQRLLDLIPPIVFKFTIKKGLNVIKGNNDALQGSKTWTPPVNFIHQSVHSYSRLQEDLLLDYMFKRKANGTYIDIGAPDPFYNNNTCHFYLRGWRGINIEQGTASWEKLCNERPDDVNLLLQVIDYGDNKENSLQLSSGGQQLQKGSLTKVLDMFLNGRQFDLLAVNTNATAVSVLKSNDWEKYRPSLVLIRANSEDRDIQLFMDRQNYLYIYCNGNSSIFVDKTSKEAAISDMISFN